MGARDILGVGGIRSALFALGLSLSCSASGTDFENPRSSPGTTDRQEVIDEVVVVAHKHARARSDIAATVSVFDSENMRFELTSSIADVFRYAPGIDYEASGTRFGSESINIRGISGNRVAILVDGVPVSDQFDVGSATHSEVVLAVSGG